MDLLHVFVDEYGDPHLDTRKEGVSGAYIIAAVCVRAADLSEARSAAEAIRRRDFQTGEMKSSVVGGNDGRRLKILHNLSGLRAFVISFCAMKGGIPPSTGLEYKKSFMKFFAKRLYDRILLCADEFRVLIDEHGTPEFQNELKVHFEKAYSHDLFPRGGFSFANSKDEVLLQVADFYAGSLARVYDEKRRSVRSDEIKGALRSSTSTTLWPHHREDFLVPIAEHLSEHDERIRRHCVKRAEAYLTALGARPDDPDDRARVVFVETLIAHHTWGEPGAFLPTQVLKREIAAALGEPISDHRFRSAIVAKVRDADVVISSCSRGYRLPSSATDVREFANFANSIIPPMVARVERARRGIREATLGEVDILDNPNLRELSAIVDALR